MKNRTSKGKINRRALLVAAAAGSVVGASNAIAATPKAGSGQPDREYIIRNAYIVTMERGVDDIPRGDIHVKDGVIAAIGPNLPVAGLPVIDAATMIAMPGMIDTHWHLWTTAMRNMQRAGTEYFPVKQAFVKLFTPNDHYQANRLSLVEAINSGITTIANFSHNVRSGAHADAELKAMAESGIRGRYYYGPSDPLPPEKTCDMDDIKRVKSQWFGKNSPFEGRVDLGVAMRGFRGTTNDTVAAEYRFAKDQGLPTITHVSATKKFSQSVARLVNAGYVDLSTVLCHWTGQNEADTEALIKSGATIAIAPTSDMRTPYDTSFHDGMFELRKAGANVSLSIDLTLLADASIFQQMAAVWYVGVPWNDTFTEKLPFYEFSDVLEMGTINGAKALGIADKVGTLKVGKRADIVLVRTTDMNMVPLGEVRSALARAANASNVDTVIIDGHVRKRAGKLVNVDVAALVRDAEASSNALRRAAGGAWAPKA